jgi:hypothetical protein
MSLEMYPCCDKVSHDNIGSLFHDNVTSLRFRDKSESEH